MLLKVKNWFKERAETAHAKGWLVSLAFAESIIFPIPIDPLLVAILLVNARKWMYYAFITTLASVLGAAVGYVLGLLFFDTVGQSIISFYFAEAEFASVAEFLNSGVFLFTFIAALTPIPFKLFVLSAGFTKANFLIFILASIFGRAVRMYGVAYLTHRFGLQAVGITRRYALPLTLIGLVIVVLYILLSTF